MPVFYQKGEFPNWRPDREDNGTINLDHNDPKQRLKSLEEAKERAVRLHENGTIDQENLDAMLENLENDLNR